MNILLVSSKFPPEYSGSGLRAFNTYKRLAAKFNVSFEVLASSVTSNKSETYEHDGVKVTKIANKISLLPPVGSNSNLIKRIIRAFVFRINYLREALPAFRYLYTNRKKYDLIHVFGNVAVTSAAISFARIFKKPLMLELVTDTKDPHQYEPFVLKLAGDARIPESSVIVCISERLKKVCTDYGYSGNIWCRPNPVNEEIFFVERQKKYKLRHKHSKFRDDDTLLVNISKIMPSKNQIFVIDVMRFLPDNFKLLMAGPVVTEGPLYKRDKAYLDSIRLKIEEYGLDERVQIETGFIENVDEFIKKADVYLFPTKEEGLGTPMLESIACGVPVVASDIPGITDSWIKDGRSGYISELEPEIFAEKIQAACGISEETLDREAEEILSIASTGIIDGEYYRRIREMVRAN